MPENGEYRRFDVESLEDVRAALDRDGVAVVKGVVDAGSVTRYRDGVFRGLSQLTAKMEKPVRQDDKSTWKTFSRLRPSHSMLVQHWGVGHMPAVWDIRQDRRVIEPFAVLSGTPAEDLLVSFDGLSVHFPPEVTGRGWYKKHWFHTDQSSTKVGRHTVQGFLNLYDVREGDATLRVLRGSHLSHESFFRDSGIVCTENWFKPSDELIARHLAAHEPACVLCDAGDLVLWDSRTFHHGVQPTKGRATSDTIRMAVYVCYTPRAMAKRGALKRKREHFEMRRTTSHWPHQPRAFAKTPQLYGEPAPDVGALDEPIVTELGMGLAGF